MKIGFKIPFSFFNSDVKIWGVIMNTLHYNEDKEIRRNTIEKYIGYGDDIMSAEIDRGHKNGSEIHVVTNSGIIKIYNARTKKHITDLIGRPSQIKRVYNAKGVRCPKWLIEIAIENCNRGFNIV